MTPRQNLESKSMVWKFTDNNNALHCVAILRAMHWQLKTEKEKMLQVKNPKVKSKIQHSTKSVAVKLYQMYCCFSVLPLYPATTRWRQKTQKKNVASPKCKIQSLNQCCETVPILLLLCSVAILRATRWRQKTRQLLLVLSKDCF